MKFFLLATFVSFSSLSLAGVPHLDLEMTSEEFRALLQHNKDKSLDAAPVATALKWGDRLAKWLAFENARRTPETQLRLSSATSRGNGIPISAPSIYSIKTITDDIESMRRDYAPEMIDVLEGAKFPQKLPGADDAEFVKWARRVDRNYQTAARYKSLLPWRSAYISAQAKDVRGYYFFKTNNWSADTFANFHSLPANEQETVRQHLVGMCMNDLTTEREDCEREVTTADRLGRLGTLFPRFYSRGEAQWRRFFEIPLYAVRRDVEHTDPNHMIVPFNRPKIAKFAPYVKDNVEDEFRWGDWKLTVKFGVFSQGPRLTFRPGVVPHVTGLGGNEIVMDSNQPIEEFDSQWTIRHEFGHVIGLPDCYHEFYDTKLDAFVNYQLDVKDLMCSRAGDMNERIAGELQKMYRR